MIMHSGGISAAESRRAGRRANPRRQRISTLMGNVLFFCLAAAILLVGLACVILAFKFLLFALGTT